MEKIGVFPGSFDPITIGHKDVIDRALPLFDKIIIAIGNNTKKSSSTLFPIEKRINWIRKLYQQESKVQVQEFKGLTIEFCHQVNAKYMIRGIRSASDFEYEKTLAQLNMAMDASIETLLILTKPELSHISSTIVRELLLNNGDVTPFVPKGINTVIDAET